MATGVLVPGTIRDVFDTQWVYTQSESVVQTGCVQEIPILQPSKTWNELSNSRALYIWLSIWLTLWIMLFMYKWQQSLWCMALTASLLLLLTRYFLKTISRRLSLPHPYRRYPIGNLAREDYRLLLHRCTYRHLWVVPLGYVVWSFRIKKAIQHSKELFSNNRHVALRSHYSGQHLSWQKVWIHPLCKWTYAWIHARFNPRIFSRPRQVIW